jgi:hypothetical protein
MIIKYYPDNAEEKVFDFYPGALENPDTEAIESVGGETWSTYEEFGSLFFRGSQKAYRAALWIMLRKTEPRLKFTDIRFRAEQVAVDYSEKEQSMIRDALLANPMLDQEERQRLEEILDGDTVAETEMALVISGTVKPADLKEPSESLETDSLTSATPDSVPVSQS